MAAPVVVASGAMAVVPAFMTAAPHVAALAQTSSHTLTTSPRTITAHLDAVVKPATPAARSYTVQRGDTLYGISQRYWGNGKYWPALYQANRSKISDPNLIYAGQVLTIPSGRHQASSAPAPSTPLGWRTALIDGLDFDVSSSEIRERLAQGQPAGEMVPAAVGHCISRRDLYAVPR